MAIILMNEDDNPNSVMVEISEEAGTINTNAVIYDVNGSNRTPSISNNSSWK